MKFEDFDCTRKLSKSEISNHFLAMSIHLKIPPKITINVDNIEVRVKVDSRNRIFSGYLFKKFHLKVGQEVRIVRKNEFYYFSVKQ